MICSEIITRLDDDSLASLSLVSNSWKNTVGSSVEPNLVDLFLRMKAVLDKTGNGYHLLRSRLIRAFPRSPDLIVDSYLKNVM